MYNIYTYIYIYMYLHGPSVARDGVARGQGLAPVGRLRAITIMIV